MINCSKIVSIQVILKFKHINLFDDIFIYLFIFIGEGSCA